MPAPDAAFTEAQLRVRAVCRRALADAVISARTAAGLTQQQVAERSGLSRSAIARLEAGEASLSTDRIWDLGRALGLRPSAIFAAAEADVDAAEALELGLE